MYSFFSSRRRHTRLTCDWSSDVCSSDLEKLPKEVDNILGYVAQLKEVTASISEVKRASELRNVTREDIGPTITGTNTKDIVADMPDSQDNYLKVEKIL